MDMDGLWQMVSSTLMTFNSDIKIECTFRGIQCSNSKVRQSDYDFHRKVPAVCFNFDADHDRIIYVAADLGFQPILSSLADFEFASRFWIKHFR